MVKKHNHRTRILEFLLSHKREDHTIRSMASKIMIDYKTVYLEVQALIQKKLIRARKIGQTTLCSLNQKIFDADLFAAELMRREKLLQKKQFAVLDSYFKDIQEPFFILLLFGSRASEKTRPGSDIDLMLITSQEPIQRKIKDALSLIPLKTHLIECAPNQFLSMIKTTEFNVGKEAFANNIILYGIEDYYRLIHHA